MMGYLAYGMVFGGALLMLYNIYRYIRFARSIQSEGSWQTERRIFLVPTMLLMLFFLGYLVVGALGHPDLVIGGILFGGSVFVLVMVLFIQNMVDRIKENEHLSAQLTAAEETSRAKGNFLSTMSHEMRTPLNAIIGLNTLALGDAGLSPTTRDKIEKSQSSAQHLLTLINDILDMSRIDSGRMTLKDEPFCLRELLEQINAIIEHQCEEKRLGYRCETIGILDGCYRGDNMKLKQVLINILGNAVKFTESPGTVTFTTEQLASADGESPRRTLRFKIADTGVGIDEEYLPKLFSAFTQEDASSTNRYGGSGLGMAIAKSIVTLMDGSIEVETQKGVGSTFTITVSLGSCDPSGIGTRNCRKGALDEETGADAETADAAEPPNAPDGEAGGAVPASLQAEAPDTAALEAQDGMHATRREEPAGTADKPSAPAAEAEPEDETPSLKGLHVLIAEDVDLNAEILADLLDIEDISSDRAANGQVALEMFERSEPGTYGAILMDMRMPVMDGLQAAMAIRKLAHPDAQSVPIIALTANAFDEDVQRSLQAGMDAHLSKPVDVDVLLDTLKGLLHKGA